MAKKKKTTAAPPAPKKKHYSFGGVDVTDQCESIRQECVRRKKITEADDRDGGEAKIHVSGDFSHPETGERLTFDGDRVRPAN